MSTKVAKVSKTSTKTAPAKAVSKVTEKAPAKTTTTVKSTPSVRLSEEDKATDSATYILNPNTNKHVKRDTPLGKKLVKAEENGEKVPKTMTETERLILVVQTLVDHGVEDSFVKAALKTIVNDLPRGFPVAWGGKQKTARSPDHPKQPSNAYIFFTKAVRPSVVEANPGLSNTDIVSLMAKMWKETAEEDRTEYNELAAEDKERYESEMKVFEAEHPDQARAKSSPGKPTKATAYHKYCEENRDTVKEENPDLDGKAITKLLAEQWEEVKKDEAEHAKYQALADEANEGFEERVTEYHEGDSPKKLSEAEQAKANDPEHYELNPKTGRYVRKEEKKAASPKVAEKKVAPKLATKATKPASKPAAKETEEAKPAKAAAKPAAKTVAKPKLKAAKTVAEGVENDEIAEAEAEAEQTEASVEAAVEVEKDEVEKDEVEKDEVIVE
jgi:hypothetical protein